ncbi:MAG: hypothetical protein KDE51_00175, partial [Anaerolineales bacterium]|nr:hypothetical protein [Anaerolineales bacterium]
MAQNQNGVGMVQRHELEELRNRIEFVNEERRKMTRQLDEMRQTIDQQNREILQRENRIRDLETRLLNATSQLNRVSQIDTTLQQFKDELVGLIEQYDQRRLQAAGEAERLRRVEQESQLREISEIRKELPEIGRLRTDMELRQAEESRLSQLISKLQTRLPIVENRIESWERDLNYLSQDKQQWVKSVAQLEASIQDQNRRIEPLMNRLDILVNDMLKAESNIQDLTGLQVEVRQTLKEWVDQIQLGEYERNQRVENWNRQIDEYKNRLEQFTKDWVTFSDQYKEAQMAVEAIGAWQQQFEKQQREASDIARVESTRLQSRWDNFLAEYDKRWRNFEIEHEQRNNDTQRRAAQLDEQIHDLREMIKDLQGEKDSIWRVQAAQLDAIKNLPRIWQEEVEKARSRDPNRRRPA